MRAALLAAAVCALLGGCQDSTLRADRRQLLGDTAERVILPIYRTLATRATGLRDAAAALHGAPTLETLRAARDAWRAARRPWKLSEAFLLGPAETLRTLPAIDWPRADGAQIEAAIAGAQPLDGAFLGAAGSPQKGFLAIEYLLFDPARGDDAVLADLAGSERRRRYALSAAEALAGSAAALLQAWEPAGGDFAAQLREAGGGSQAFGSQKQAVDALVNRLIFLVEKVAVTRLGKPLGTMDGAPQPAEEEARRSDNSIADLGDNVRGVLAIYTCSHEGQGGLAISELVRRQDEAADAGVRERIRAAISAIEQIPFPLRTALLGSPQTVRAAYDQGQELRRTLATQIAGLLGVTLKFNDNDGD